MNLPNINQVTVEMNDRAREIWLAGLGAVSRVRSEGEKLFAGLVAEGADYERDARKRVAVTVTKLRKEADGRFNDASKKTAKRWRGLESAFESRVAAVLSRFDVPTRANIDKLARQVNKLKQEIKALEASQLRKA